MLTPRSGVIKYLLKDNCLHKSSMWSEGMQNLVGKTIEMYFRALLKGPLQPKIFISEHDVIRPPENESVIIFFISLTVL